MSQVPPSRNRIAGPDPDTPHTDHNSPSAAEPQPKIETKKKMFTTETLSTLSSEKFLLKNSYLRALCASVVSPLFDRYMEIDHRENLREPRKLSSIIAPRAPSSESDKEDFLCVLGVPSTSLRTGLAREDSRSLFCAFYRAGSGAPPDKVLNISINSGSRGVSLMALVNSSGVMGLASSPTIFR